VRGYEVRKQEIGDKKQE